MILLRVRRASLHRYDWEFYVGPWMGRLAFDRYSSFGWRDGDGAFTRWIRRWWSGWHRWDDNTDC